jgi:hypothetical protein
MPVEAVVRTQMRGDALLDTAAPCRPRRLRCACPPARTSCEGNHLRPHRPPAAAELLRRQTGKEGGCPLRGHRETSPVDSARKRASTGERSGLPPKRIPSRLTGAAISNKLPPRTPKVIADTILDVNLPYWTPSRWASASEGLRGAAWCKRLLQERDLAVARSAHTVNSLRVGLSPAAPGLIPRWPRSLFLLERTL